MMLEQDPPRARPESETTASDPLSGLAAGLGEAVPGAVPPQDPTPADAMPAGQPIGAMQPTDPAAAEPPAEVPPEEPTAPPIPPIPPTPEAQALANARGGRWAMNEYFDGLVLLGADGRPVMRADRTRVGFFFADAPRLAARLAKEQGAPADPRRALAPLDAGFDGDWDPQIQKSYFATMTKMTRLMAYDYVRTTEPEEAVRKAVATIFGNPRHIDEPGMKVWVPGKYDVGAVKTVANTLMHRLSGPESAKGSPSPATHFPLSTSTNPQSAPLSVIPQAPADVDIAANIAEAVKQRGNPFWFRNQVITGGPWDYKGPEKEFEDFGNFHYGATGAAMGFSEETLLRMAGRQQVIDRSTRPEYGGVAPNPVAAIYGIGGKAPFQDDPKDQYWISQGYQYYHQQKERWEPPPLPPSKLRGGRKPESN